jgi:uncharacterized protein YndB with AHSA1/START domain
MTTVATTTDFVISRVFDAPRDLVWDAWTDAASLAQWWGPKGFDIDVHRLEVKPGGMFLYSMKTGAQEMWGRFVFKEVVKPERLVYISAFSDPDGNVTRAPFFDGRWPLEVSNILTFTEQGTKTRIDLRGGPVNATADELAAFVANEASMQQGFGGTFAQLDHFLAQARGGR